MRHLTGMALLAAGGAVSALGLGPAFFGPVLLGALLLLAGLGLELAAWRRLRRGSSPARSG